MNIYRYHPVTKELTGKRVTIKPETPGVDETDLLPPVCGGTQTPVFSNGAWTIVPDYRRVILYIKATRQSIRLALGVEPDNTVTNIKPTDSTQVWDEAKNKWVYPLSVQKAQKTTEVFRLCDKKLNEVLSYYPKTEPDTWPEKTKMSELWISKTDEERIAILQDPPNAIRVYGMLFAEAVGIYIPNNTHIAEITSLAGRILGNKVGFGIYAGMLMKIKTDTARLITEATTEEELNAISIDFSSVSLAAIRQALGG